MNDIIMEVMITNLYNTLEKENSIESIRPLLDEYIAWLDTSVEKYEKDYTKYLDILEDIASEVFDEYMLNEEDINKVKDIISKSLSKIL